MSDFDNFGPDAEPLTLAELLTYDLEPIDGDNDLVRVVETGRIRRDPSAAASVSGDVKEPKPPPRDDVGEDG